ncbi:MAG: response regulator transcription factor [Bdellovibrionota bacterium]
MKNVAIIEDEQNIAEMLSYMLSKNSFIPNVYHSAEEYFMAKKFDTASAYIVDLNLPGINGINIIKFIRSHDKISPIFIISGTLSDKVVTEGLDAGADDYVMKPFNPNVLLMKLENASRKVRKLREESLNDGLKIIDESHTVVKDGTFILLTGREYLIVKKLFEAKSNCVSREALIDNFPGEDVTVRTIDTHICSARKKLKRAQISIRTIRGVGYAMVS